MFNYRQLDPARADWVAVARAGDLANGERAFLEIDGRPIVLFQIAGEHFAIDDLCTHDDGPLGEGELDDAQVECPRHGARFDLRTGKALSLPAVVDIASYPVRLVDGEIQIGLPPDLP
jgi:3-phenylpropionate/trans-cinnamate dioxygenase ferredoxin component